MKVLSGMDYSLINCVIVAFLLNTVKLTFELDFYGRGKQNYNFFKKCVKFFVFSRKIHENKEYLNEFL